MKISCICGYVYEKESSDKKPKQGDKPFLEIFVGTSYGHSFDEVYTNTVENTNRGMHKSDYSEVELYACPKCGTIRLKNYRLVEKE